MGIPLDIVLVGAGRHGRNMIGIIEDVPGLRITCVLDDRPEGDTLLGYPLETLAAHAGHVRDAVLAIGNGATRRAVVAREGAAGFRWHRMIHPMTQVSRHAEIGEGSTVLPFTAIGACRLGAHVAVLPSCVVGSGVVLGDFTSLMPHVLIGSDTVLGAGCTICAGARILAGLTIGDRCIVAPNTVLDRDMPADTLAVMRGPELRIVRRPRASEAPEWLQAS